METWSVQQSRPRFCTHPSAGSVPPVQALGRDQAQGHSCGSFPEVTAGEKLLLHPSSRVGEENFPRRKAEEEEGVELGGLRKVAKLLEGGGKR